VRIIRPRALLLENVRGLSTTRFSAYRQHVLDRLRDQGYVPGWRLLNSSDYGVPQLRPRTVLVALQRADAHVVPLARALAPAARHRRRDPGRPDGRADRSRPRSSAAPRSTAALTWARPGPSAPGPSSAWTAIRRALEHADVAEAAGPTPDFATHDHDPVFRVLRARDDFLTVRQIADLARLSPAAVRGHLRHLTQNFELEMAEGRDGPAYRLGPFRAFLGQRDHARHQRFAASRATIS
jgi:site-specific DNA-cytosine methylase